MLFHACASETVGPSTGRGGGAGAAQISTPLARVSPPRSSSRPCPLLQKARICKVGAALGASGDLPAWNFSKYVIDKQGAVVAFFPSSVTPEDPRLRSIIAQAIASN